MHVLFLDNLDDAVGVKLGEAYRRSGKIGYIATPDSIDDDTLDAEDDEELDREIGN
jgi:hypothetical protein